MEARAPQRSRRVMIAVVAVACLFGTAPVAVAAPAEPADDRPFHPGAGDGPPPHASAPAPEERPPAHAQARRSSARPAAGATPASSDRTDGPPATAGPGRAVPPGRAGDAPSSPPPADHPDAQTAPELHPELDTDIVAGGGRRDLPHRTQAAAGSPIVLAAPAASGGTGDTSGLRSPVTSPFTPDTAGQRRAAAPVDADAPSGTVRSSGGEVAPQRVLAAPRVRAVPDAFVSAELHRRVVVPVLLLVAGLLYLLAQGRIDRRGQLLTVPQRPGAEHDDDVYEL